MENAKCTLRMLKKPAGLGWRLGDAVTGKLVEKVECCSCLRFLISGGVRKARKGDLVDWGGLGRAVLPTGAPTNDEDNAAAAASATADSRADAVAVALGLSSPAG